MSDNYTVVLGSGTNLNSGQAFFMILGMLPFLICLPTWVVAKFVWEPMELERRRVKKLFNERRKEYKNRETPYEMKYPLNSNTTDVDPKISNIIVENTPIGYVAMRYNQAEAGFEYWTNKTISYSYLETVARRYVNIFNCTELYIDRKKHLKDKIQRLKQEIKENLEAKKKLEKEQEKSPSVEKEDVFATLKKYNTAISTKTSEKEKLTRDDFVCDEANKYIRKGKFTDCKRWIKLEDHQTASNTTDSASTLSSWLYWKQRHSD